MKEKLIIEIKKLIPLTDEGSELIRELFMDKKLSKNEYLLKEGNQCKFECLVIKGILRNYYEKGEDELITHFSKEGDWASDYRSLLSGSKSQLNIQALEETKVLLISKAGLDDLQIKIPHWDRVGKLFYENQFQKKEEDFKKRISKSAEERYSDIVKYEPYLLERVPLRMISQYLGIKAESLSRIRKRMAQKGIS